MVWERTKRGVLKSLAFSVRCELKFLKCLDKSRGFDGLWNVLTPWLREVGRIIFQGSIEVLVRTSGTQLIYSLIGRHEGRSL